VSVSTEYLNFIRDKLAPAGDVKSRAMFGSYGIFHEDLMFAIISEDVLYFKVNDTNREIYQKAGSNKFPHGISYWEVPDEVLEDDEKLQEWAGISITIARSARVAKGKKRR
jgi:DNA transformation protein